MKYITLTMVLILEFLVISAFVVTPIEHSCSGYTQFYYLKVGTK